MEYLSPFYLAKNVIPHTIPHEPDVKQGKKRELVSIKKTRL
jgi:hypothetical protein